MNALAASLRRFLLPVLAGISISLAGAPANSTGEVVDIDAKAVITKLGDGLTVGRTQLYTELSRLGFSAEVAELKELSKSQLHAFSAHSVLESLYRRAEVAVAGEGERFLAILYEDAASKSAALSQDPDFAAFRSRFSAATLDIATRPIRFAPVAAVSDLASRPPLTPVVERAITKLSFAHAGKGIAQMRSVVLRTFRKEGFDSRTFERALLESNSQVEALRRIVVAGTPPPTAEAALRTLLMGAREGSAAFFADHEALRIMEELSRELPPELKRYADAEDKLDSRTAQMAEAGKLKQAGKVRKGGDADVLALLQGPDPNTGNSVERTPPPVPDGPIPGNKGGSGVGGSPSSAEAKRASNSYDKYIDETFEPRGPPPTKPVLQGPSRTGPTTSPPTSRRFTTARFSARAGRGISVGAIVKNGVSQKIKKAFWLPNERDDRFGRIFLTFRNHPGGPPAVAASRTVFTDSFRAARSALWDKYGTTSDFHEGEILVLMSMDPDSPISKKARADAQKLGKAIQDAAMAKLEMTKRQRYTELELALKDTKLSFLSRFTYEMEMREIERDAYNRLGDKAMKEKLDRIKAQRGVVTHPALFGRELVWSSIRIDFWLNRLDVLANEARQMNGGTPMPAALRSIPTKGMATWQYYERDAVISIRKSEGKADQLVVQSVDEKGQSSASGQRSHFAVTMFSEGKTPESIKAEDGLYRRPDVERKMQPMLDWLAINHHDYMRLNDFSESFSLLRWLRISGIQVEVMDLAGDKAKIATPDRVDIGSGPQVGAK